MKKIIKNITEKVTLTKKFFKYMNFRLNIMTHHLILKLKYLKINFMLLMQIMYCAAIL